MSAEKFLPYAHQSIEQADIDEVAQSLSSDLITRGPKVEAFEKKVANYCGAKHGIAFCNASAALMAAYQAAKISPSDRILTTPNTFIASVGPGIQRQATPVFLDIERTTGNLNLEQLKYNLELPSSRGRTFIVPVHFAGIPVNMRAIDKMIHDPNTIVIEDAAHALGSEYPNGGSKVGSCEWSHMTIFSFHPAKTITTGEGGMVTTNDDELCHRLRLCRNNGIERDPQFLLGEATPWYYEVMELTSNFNFTEMQGALGLSQMKRLDQFAGKRKRLMSAYREKLSSLEHIKMFDPAYDAHSTYHLCVVQIDFKAYRTTRTEVMNALKEKGIGTQVHYIPIYRFPFLSLKQPGLEAFFPEMETYYEQALSLPFYYDLTLEDVERVVNSLKQILKKR